MSSKKLATTTILPYGDPLSLILLWQKALLMVPLWAIPLVLAAGLILRHIGSFALELGFGALLCWFVIYFLEDSLKRKIRIDEHNIFFGFKAIPIKDIVSLEVGNKKSKLLPAHVVLRRNGGGLLNLRLDGLSDKSVESMLTHLRSHNSQIQVSPVLSTLLKARRAPQLPLVIPDRFELSYQAGPLVGESIAVVRTTAGKWMRLGPIVVSLLVAPMWIAFLSNLYATLQPHSFESIDQFGLDQFLTQLSSGLSHALWVAGNAGSTAIFSAAHNSLAAWGLAIGLGAMFCYTLRMLWRPNRLIIDNQSLTTAMRLGALTVPLARVQWPQVKRLQLLEDTNNATKINIERDGQKALNLDLSAIAVDERSLLLKRIEECVPTCQIEHQVAQSLLPQSEHSYTELWLQSLTQAPEHKTLDPLEPGQLVGDGRFEMLHSLGVGGQGTAYLCRDTKSDNQSRSVVLKETILPVFVDPLVRRKALESFEHEAKLLQTLAHPGIVRLVDYFVEDHRAYLVMEHISGSNLRDIVLRQGPLSEERLQELAKQMCNILQYLHDQAVVHRDFTPDNLLLDPNNNIRLIDFNVAQQTQGGSQGTIVGKPAYMPPEQFRGKASTQSDIYAMGATLFFLLTASDPDPISQSCPSSKHSAVSKPMDDIVKHATALQLKNRYQSVSEILDDLDGTSGSEAAPASDSQAQAEAAQDG